jgi:hypothetical protein
MRTVLGVLLAFLCVGASAQRRIGSPTTDALQQLAEITGSQPYALTSSTVAISGNTLVVSAPLATPPNASCECGAAFVYTAVNGDWANLQLTATLTQSNGQSVGGFGESVAISGGVIVVGGADSSSGLGAAYVFISPSGTVTQDAELTTSGPASGAFSSVSIDGGTIVAGSPLASAGSQRELGAAYIYAEPPDGWVNMTQTAQLAANDESTNCGFGNSVSISGRTVAVGAPRASVDGLTYRGRAYVYVEPAGGWSGTQGQTTELQPSNGVREAGFGVSVSASGDTVAVGASGQTSGSNQAQGAVYVFAEPATGWPKTMTETAELSAGTAGGQLGSSVAISGSTLLAGAPDVHDGQGLAYVFAEPEGGWEDSSRGEAIAASDGSPNNYFGHSVSVGEGVLGVTAVGWPDGGASPDGAVYVFGKSQ